MEFGARGGARDAEGAGEAVGFLGGWVFAGEVASGEEGCGEVVGADGARGDGVAFGRGSAGQALLHSRCTRAVLPLDAQQSYLI